MFIIIIDTASIYRFTYSANSYFLNSNLEDTYYLNNNKQNNWITLSVIP